jgi:hypothetical protein
MNNRIRPSLATPAIAKRASFGKAMSALENKQFTVEQLAAGAEMLRDLWFGRRTDSAAEPSDA